MGPITRPPTTPARLAPHRRFRPIAPAPQPASTGADPWRLRPGEPATFRRDLGAFAAVWAQLGLLLALVRVYQVEGRGLLLLMALAWASLPIHYLLPSRQKRGFFLLVSVVGLVAVWGLAVGAVTTTLALGLVAICRLPIAWSARVGIVAACAVGLGIARATLAASWPLVAVVGPVLGSMLMFRMILYLYELKHADRPGPLLDDLGYFFLLPNYAFLHFPVVDYRTLGRSFGAVEVHQTQRVGLRMILRGVGHLLAYRLVERWLLVSSAEVVGPATLLAHLATNYFLYLRVSGQFHVACGMLHLFGHHLPTTHRNYFLASGFTDYWRRINIYWKDFMVRVVFHPVAFRLKRRARWQALGSATAAVFAATWALHAYQKFWLLGAWGVSVPDALFWGILGVLVVVNVQLDARDRPEAAAPPSWWLRGVQTLATFATLATLWSLWSSPTLADWLAMVRRGVGGA